MIIKSILVGVDGSENSDRALDFALDLAEKFNASITILNVTESLVINAFVDDSNSYLSGKTTVLDKDLRKIHDEILTRNVARAKTVKPNLTVSSMLKEGNPALEIVNTAKEEGFNVIIVGHKGLSKVEELFLGSVSEKEAHLTPCPVVIVK